jgi:membrane protein implicated in regulation of membrane protease activity
MSAINRFRLAVADELKAQDKDRRVEAWICFLFALVVAPAAYIQGTPHWPYAAVGLAFTAVWLVLTLSRRNRLRTQRLANKPMQPTSAPSGARGSRSKTLTKAEDPMSAIKRFRSAISDELKARDKDRRLEAWICFLFALVVALIAYIQGTPQWPYAVVGLGFAAVWLVLTLSRRNPVRRLRLANKSQLPTGAPSGTGG